MFSLLLLFFFNLSKEIESLTAELKSKKASCDSFFNNEIKTVLCELERLYSTKIIDGNCDLKIARQKYFLEKLDEVLITFQFLIY